ncbi:MAG: LON peptidase substrate-binding domain-containing protein [Dehalococcoidia bacterium]
MARIPLFPLNTVLFPHALLPLHIFEERYKTMINRCIDEQAPFGVVLIRSGVAVGGAAEPYDVGSTARISRVQRLPDGRMDLIALGERRFRIVSLDTSEAYLQGEVEFVESEDADTPDAVDQAARVAALFGEQFRLKLSATGQWARTLDLPSDSDALADFVAGQLDVPAGTQQSLLETLSVPERLRREAEILGDTIRQLTERWEERRREKYAGGALN